jgi:hypothetical protein
MNSRREMSSPSALYYLQFSNITTTGFKVNWLGGDGATSYEYSLNGSSVPLSVNVSTDVAGKSAIFTNLPPGTLYKLVVIAVNDSGSTVSVSAIDTTNLQMWFDASTLIDPSSTPVPTLTNLASTSYSLITPNGRQPPTISSNTLNSLPVLSYTTSQGQVVDPSFTGLYTQQSFFAVSRQTGGTNSRVFESTDSDLILGYWAGNKKVLGINGNPNTIFTGISSDTNWDIISLTLDTSTGVSFAWNGELILEQSSTNALSNIGINAGGGNASHCEIAEIIFYNSNLDSSQRQSIEGYLAWKWGLQASLPSNHVYAAVAPVAQVGTTIQLLPDSPSSITITNITTNGFTAQWPRVNNATTYEYSMNNANPINIPSNNDNIYTVSFTDVIPGSPNTLTVKSRNAGGLSDPGTTVNVQLPPGILVISEYTTQGFQLTWVGGGAISYEIYINTVLKDNLTIDLENKTVYIPGLYINNGPPHALYVRAINDGDIANSEPIYIEDTPTKPINLTYTSSYNSLDSSAIVTITFDGGDGATNYISYLTYVADERNRGSSTTKTIESNIRTDPGESQVFIIKAINANNQRFSISDPITVIIPPALTSLSIESISSTGFTIYWAPSNAVIDNYKVYIDDILKESLTDNRAFTYIYGNYINDTHTVRVTATNAAGSVSISSVFGNIICAVSNITDSGFKVNWTGGAWATGYLFNCNGGITPTTLTSNQAIFTDLDSSITQQNINNSFYIIGQTDVINVTSNIVIIVFKIVKPVINGIVSEKRSVLLTYNGVNLDSISSRNIYVNGIPKISEILPVGDYKFAIPINLTSPYEYTVVLELTRESDLVLSDETLIYMLPSPIDFIKLTNITNTGFIMNWTGGLWGTQNHYFLNSVEITPSLDETILYNRATFTGITLINGDSVDLSIFNNHDDSVTINSVIIKMPSYPTDLLVSNISSTDFQVSWSGADMAVYYTYYINGLLVVPLTEDIVTKTATFTTPGGNISFSIEAVGDSFTSSLSVPITINLPPTVITSLLFSDITSTGFQVRWSGGNGATVYRYYINDTVISPTLDQGINNHFASFTGLEIIPGNTFYIIALNGQELIRQSDTISIPSSSNQLLKPVLGVPYNISTTGFEIQVQSEGSIYNYYTSNGLLLDSQYYLENNPGINIVTFQNLTPGSDFTVSIGVINDNTLSLSDPITVTLFLENPSLITVTNRTSIGFTAEWPQVNGATSYDYGLNNGSLINISGNTLIVSNLISGSSNTLIVKSKNVTQISDPGTTIQIKLLPDNPSPITITNITTTGFVAQWAGVNSAIMYTYSINGAESISILSNNDNIYTVSFTDLVSGSPNTLTVKSRNGGGFSYLGTSISIQLLPDNPSLITITNRTSTGFTAHWSRVNGATSYDYRLNGGSVINISGNTLIVSDLTVGSTNTLLVKSKNVTGLSNPGTTVNVTLYSNFTPVIHISNITSTGFNALWDTTNDIISYNYRLNNAKVIIIPAGTGVSYTLPVNNLVSGSVNTFRVDFMTSSGPIPSNLYTIILAPLKPMNLQYSIIEVSKVRVSWSGGDGATEYIYKLNDIQFTPILDKGLEHKYIVFNIPNINATYQLTIIAINATNSSSQPQNTIPSDKLLITLGSRPYAANKKTLVYVYSDRHPFSFGEFVSGVLFLLHYANKNRMGVRINIENTPLSDYLIVENYKIPPGFQTKLYYNDKDSKLLADNLQIFKGNSDSIILITTNSAVHRNEIDSLCMLEFHKLIQFSPEVYEFVNARLRSDLINPVVPPQITDQYNVINMYLANTNLNRSEIQSLSAQIHNTLDLSMTSIIIASNDYIRNTLTEFLGGYHVPLSTRINTLSVLESNIVDFIIVSKSKKIYTFSEYNSKHKKASYDLRESTSLSTLILPETYYTGSTTVSTFAGVFPEADFTDGTTNTAAFAYPSGITEDISGNIYIADTMNNNIRKITNNGIVSTIAGSHTQATGSTNGIGTNARFSGPTGATTDLIGNVYIVDAINGLIRKIGTNGNVTTLAGSTAGFNDGVGSTAKFKFLYTDS